MTERPARWRAGTRVGRFTAAHALPRRIRLKSPLLAAPAFDANYFQAFLEALPGVEAVRVNPRGQCLVVEHDGSEAAWLRLEAALAAIPPEACQPAGDDSQPVGLADVGVKALLTLLAQALPFPAKAALSWLAGLGVIIKGVETLAARGVKVEVLDAAAVTLSLLRRQYFTAGTIATLLSLGHYLEDRTERRSTALLKGLLRPQAERVWVIRDGVELEIPVGQVQAGETVVCGAGEMIPVDGVVAEGEASVNLSSISGESVPVHVKPGDAAVSGSVVEDGRLLVTVERVGSETSMARISRFIEQSLRGKSKAQTRSAELADRLVPLTLGLSAFKYLLTGSLQQAVSVLTVDFSCAVKLASPVAVRSAMHAAGKAGVLLKGASALDALQDVDAVVFDKTGTLTTGQLAVTNVLPVGDLTPDELLALAAGAEEHYDHPVARAVVREAKARNLALPPISRVDFIVAHGVSAAINGWKVLVGSHHFIAEDEGVDCAAFDRKAKTLRRSGKSLLYVARDRELVGVVALRDAPRPEAGAVLDALKAQGVRRLITLTGDHEDTAKALGRQLPQLDEIHFELRPEDKAAIVKRLKASGLKLAYVGDGVNDAPALVCADVGVCMPKGADLARESAQVLLLTDDLTGLAVARAAAARTGEVIRRGFAAAIGGNALIMLLAARGLAPIASALLHNVSTIGILGYSAYAASRPLADGLAAPSPASAPEASC